MSRACKSPTARRHDLAGGRGEEPVALFNQKFPVGTTVWFWRNLPFGPVRETTVRSEAFLSDAGLPVAFLTGVSGYVSVFHVSEPREDQRACVKFEANP